MRARNLILLFLLLVALVLIPFAVFHEQIDAWTSDLLRQPHGSAAWLAGLIIVLLAVDILLPVPSSVLSTGAGYLLGFVPGLLVSFIGMTLGILLGYWLGQRAQRVLPWLDAATTEWLERFFRRRGHWAIALARPVPVLAETSVVFAGMSRMPALAFLSVAAAANLGISLAYAGIGAYAFSANSFLWAFLGAIAIPLGWALVQVGKRVVARRRERQHS